MSGFFGVGGSAATRTIVYSIDSTPVRNTAARSSAGTVIVPSSSRSDQLYYWSQSLFVSNSAGAGLSFNFEVEVNGAPLFSPAALNISNVPSVNAPAGYYIGLEFFDFILSPSLFSAAVNLSMIKAGVTDASNNISFTAPPAAVFLAPLLGDTPLTPGSDAIIEFFVTLSIADPSVSVTLNNPTQFFIMTPPNSV